MRVRLLALALAVGVATGAPALDDSDREAMRAVVERQIEAFRRDDASAAYALASPGIQALFPSPEIFLDMVRQGYRPVHRPRSVEFGPARDAEGGPERAVRLQDAEGVDWDAVYSFERQPDGTWRISGCRLVKRPGEAV